jgi:hypothetical protein
MVVRQMKRYFISHAPRFGSYKNPVQWKVEQSPYYFWWLAMLYNCELGDAAAVDEQVRSDFGCVRRGESLHVEFARWWTEKVGGGERRGEYLFAEPLTGTATRVVQDVNEAARALEDTSSVLVSISLTGQRKFIDTAIDGILRKHAVFERGRTVKNPKLSQARYSLSKPVQIDAVQRVLGVYDYRQRNDGLDNYAVFKKLGLKAERQAEETIGDYRRRISTLVSRDYGAAKRMVENVGEGIFP